MHILDLKDKKILYQLDINSRQSLKKIGNTVSLTKNVVQFRINRLKEKEIINNFYTSIDFFTLGYINMAIYINYQYYTPKIEKDIIEHFINSEHSWFIANVQGKYDLIVLFLIKDLNDFFIFWRKTLDKFRYYFSEAIIAFIPRSHYFRSSYLLDDYSKKDITDFEIIDGGKKLSIDANDLRILQSLAINARKPIVEIAKELELSSTNIANRIKKLLKLGVIKGFRVNIDYLKLGLQLFNVHFNLKNYDKIGRMINYVKYHPNLISINEVIDHCDIALNFHMENFNKLHIIIKDIYNKFPDDIKNHMTFSFPEIYKHNYLPGSIIADEFNNIK